MMGPCRSSAGESFSRAIIGPESKWEATLCPTLPGSEMNRSGSTGGIQVCLMILVLGACANNKDVRVQLDAHHQTSNEPSRLTVEAQVTGPQSGLRYKWFSVLGEFEPQDSDAPKSSFF